MPTWVTSDTHFNHENILKYEPDTRPFNSVEEMNEKIIENWNKVVRPEDTVIHCGDFFMGPIEGIDNILPRLNGKIILVRGNHDTKTRIKKFTNYGIEVHDILYKTYKGIYFIFNHFPLVNEEFSKMIFEDNKSVIWCYGHVHGKAPHGLINNTFHVGMDTNNLTPVSLKSIWEDFHNLEG